MKKDYFWIRLRRKVLTNIWLTRIVLITFGFVILIIGLFNVVKSINFDNAKYLIRITNSFLFPETPNPLNLLVLGKSGKDHAGSNLTDTIIFSSIDENKKLVLVSLPRDIWIPEIRAKLNSAYYWGNQKKEGGGLALSKSLVEDIVGKRIDYAMVVDFSGFKTIIDSVGGVNVDVTNSFVDEKYPIAGKEDDLCGGDRLYKCRYERVEFKQGLTYMDGDLALKFVRSRNAKGDEGTDLARNARQQKLITALKEKVLSKEILFSPKKIKAVLIAILNAIEMDFDYIEGSALVRRILDATKSGIISHTIPEEFIVTPLISSKYDSQYVFIPRYGSWNELHKWISSLLN